MKRGFSYAFLLSFIIACLVFWNIDPVIEVLLSPFDGSRLQFVATTIDGPFISALTLAIAIGSIPLLIYMTWIAGKMTSSRAKLLTTLFIILGVIAGIAVNTFRVLSYDMEITAPAVKISFPINRLYFQHAIFLGALSGILIAFLSFRRKEK